MSDYQDKLRSEYEDRLENEVTCIRCSETYDKRIEHFVDEMCEHCKADESGNDSMG